MIGICFDAALRLAVNLHLIRSIKAGLFKITAEYSAIFCTEVVQLNLFVAWCLKTLSKPYTSTSRR